MCCTEDQGTYLQYFQTVICSVEHKIRIVYKYLPCARDFEDINVFNPHNNPMRPLCLHPYFIVKETEVQRG